MGQLDSNKPFIHHRGTNAQRKSQMKSPTDWFPTFAPLCLCGEELEVFHSGAGVRGFGQVAARGRGLWMFVSVFSCCIDPMSLARILRYSPPMNSSLKRFALLLLTAATLAFVTTGCQTSKGFGKDVEKLGDNIQKKAS